MGYFLPSIKFRRIRHDRYKMSIAFSKNKVPTLEDWLDNTDIKNYWHLTPSRQLGLKCSEILIKGDIILRDYC